MDEDERERIRQVAREDSARTRREQGLPPTITDPDVLEKIAAVARDEPREDAA
jgi:hypothetical protein